MLKNKSSWAWLLGLLVLCLVCLGQTAWAAEDLYSQWEFIDTSLDQEQGVAIFFSKDASPQDLKYLGIKDTDSLGQEYFVPDTVNKYTAIACNNMGNDMMPFVMLVANDGTVDYINIRKGIRNGFKFKINGKIQGLDRVKALEPVSDADVSSIVAVQTSGQRVDISAWLGKKGLLSNLFRM